MQSRLFLTGFLLLILNQQHVDSQEYWVPFSENNLWGIKDENGSIIIPARWDSIILDNPLYEYFDDMVLYLEKGKYGIVNIKGKAVFKPEWDAIYVNPGLSYDYNVSKSCQTESGNKTIRFLSIADLEQTRNRSYSSLPLFYIVTMNDHEIFLYDRDFNNLIPEPVTNMFVETEVFVDFGLIIVQKQEKMGILYKRGKKFTGFQYDSVSFWHTDDIQPADDYCFLKIDNQLVKYSNRGKFDFNQVNLIIPECIGRIMPYSDTRSWIYDFTVDNNNLLVTDGNSHVYCFSANKELHWIKEIPDVYSYHPVSSDGRIVIGNYVFKKPDMTGDPEILPGKEIQHPVVDDDHIIYIAETEPIPELESTEIPGMLDINPSMMGSGRKLICYHLDYRNIVWNRSLAKNHPASMPFILFKEKIIMPIIGVPEDPDYYVFIFNMENGLEQARYTFEYPQDIHVTGNNIYLSTHCSPDLDLMCDEIHVRAYTGIDLEEPDCEITVQVPGHVLWHGDSIFYLDGPEQITVLRSKKGKKFRKLSLDALGPENIPDDPERFRLLGLDRNQLFFILEEQRLFSVDLSDGKIFNYVFYVDGEWTTFKGKYPVIQENRIFIRDQQDRISIFDLSR
jgi:hypothetical protein